MRHVKSVVPISVAAVLLGYPTSMHAQERIDRRIALNPNASVKAFVPAGSVRLVGWNRDSLVITGTLGRGSHFSFGGDRRGVKFGVSDDARSEAAQPSHFDVYVPIASRVAVKCVSADIDATDLSGWFYTVGGHIHLRGRASEVEAEAMDGDITVAVWAPWVRARTGSGTLRLGGRIQDASASSITGPVMISADGLTRGKFGSVTGNVVFAAPLGEGGIFDFDDHSGAVELRLPPTTAGSFQLTTVEGIIDNNITSWRPASLGTGRGQALAFQIGSGGAHVTIRTFKGTIRLRH
jgi:hypothetical protein